MCVCVCVCECVCLTNTLPTDYVYSQLALTKSVGTDCVNSACCSVLQCVAVCCSVLQSVGTDYVNSACCSVLQCVAVCCNELQCIAVGILRVYAGTCDRSS